MSKSLVKCDHCGTEFLRENKVINRNAKLGHKNYCSLECTTNNWYPERSKTVFCAECNKQIVKLPSQAKRSQSENLFCSRSCAVTYRNKRTIGAKHPSYRSGRNTYRRAALEHYGAKCMVEECGYCIEEVLEVHHKDKNRKNNKIENLMVLCPTHHVECHCGLR